MRISLLSFGTRGDVQPLLAIADALQRRGHQVRLGAPSNHVSFVRDAGVTPAALPGDSEALLRSEQGRAWIDKGDVVSLMRAILGMFEELTDAMDTGVGEATDDAELIVSGVISAGMARMYAEKRGVPLVIAHTFPALPSRQFTSAMVDLPFALPGFLRAWSTRWLLGFLWWQVRKLDGQVRARHQLPPAMGEPTLEHFDRRGPSLHLWSPSLLPRPAEWGPENIVTGFCGIDAGVRAALREDAPLAELESFLAAGPPPVYFGLGSMPVLDPERMVTRLLEATERLGVRLVLGGSFDRPDAIRALLPDRARLSGPIDHDVLFARCAAVVHHGGAGSTATSLRAGRPTMVCSVLGDQPFWGRLVTRRGVGTFSPFRRLTTDRLHRGLATLLDPAVQARAAALGEAMRAERPGAEVAADAIEAAATGLRR